MKESDLRQLEQQICGKKAEAERAVLREKPPQRALRRRLRDPGEQEVLDRIALRKWAAAEREGKIQ